MYTHTIQLHLAMFYNAHNNSVTNIEVLFNATLV